MISWLVLILVLFILSLTLLGATYFSRQAKPPTYRPTLPPVWGPGDEFDRYRARLNAAAMNRYGGPGL